MADQWVVVSGGAGFIGTRLVPVLLEVGYRVVVLDSLHPQVHPEGRWPDELDQGVLRVHGSVESVESWLAALGKVGGPVTIVHLAAETGTGQSLREARRHASVNVLGTAAMTDALVAMDLMPRQIVLTSSRAVYGEGAWLDGHGVPGLPEARLPADLAARHWSPRLGEEFAATPLPHDATTVPPRPTNVYAGTKLAQEHLLLAWCSAMNVPLTVLRLQNVYGAGQALTNSYTGVLTFFATRAVAGEPIEVYEEGEITRDFVHVSDVVTVIVSAIRSGVGLKAPIDIGSGEPVTLGDVARLMARVADAPAPIVTDQFRPGDVRAAFASISAAQDLLGYRPAMSLEDGLRELLKFAAARGGVTPDA